MVASDSALVGEVQAAVAVELDEAVVAQAPDRLGDRGRGEPEPFHEPGPHRHHALFLDGEDRLEVLLGRVVHLGHPLRLEKMAGAAPFDCAGLSLIMNTVIRARGSDQAVVARATLPR